MSLGSYIRPAKTCMCLRSRVLALGQGCQELVLQLVQRPAELLQEREQVRLQKSQIFAATVDSEFFSTDRIWPSGSCCLV